MKNEDIKQIRKMMRRKRKVEKTMGPTHKPRDIKKANKNISLHNCFWDVVLEYGEKTKEKWSPYIADAVMKKYKNEDYGKNEFCDKICDEYFKD